MTSAIRRPPPPKRPAVRGPDEGGTEIPSGEYSSHKILEDERLAVEKATLKADHVVSNAAVAYEQAMALEEPRMRRQTSKDEKVSGVQEQFDLRLSQILRNCDRRKEVFFRKFSQDCKKLKAWQPDDSTTTRA